MRYTLRPLGNSGLLDIDEAEFSELRRAKPSLVTMIGIEQKFDLVFANHFDYERELLELSLHQALKRDLAWQAFQDDIAGVSRRLANLLAAARLYLDQVNHDLRAAFGATSDLADKVREKASEQYDTRLGYRVMEGLRNVMQHRSMPVHRLGYPGDTVNQGLRHRAVPSIEVARLADTGLKASVLAELEGLGMYVAVTPLVRDYIEGLGMVHETVRSLAATQVAEWDSILEAAQRRGRDRWGGDHQRAFLAQQIEDDGRVSETIEVFTELTRYRRVFESRNSLLSHLARRYVSSECSQRDA